MMNRFSFSVHWMGLLLLASSPVFGQPDDPTKGSNRWTQWGVMDGNRVRSLFSNHGEISRWPEQPSGEWPKGSGRSYVDGVALIVSAKTKDSQGNTIYPMSTNYREFINRDPVTKVPWGWAPLRGYSNPIQPFPARSDDPSTWPSIWADRPIDWAGQWNGWFGKGVQNADLETYFVFDDAEHMKWVQAPHLFYPCSDDPNRGGLGLQVKARGLQWNHPLAQDVIFWLYEITNECDVDYDEVFFAQYIDWGIGGTDDSGDDEGAYNKKLDLAFAWDRDGLGTPGQWGPVGTTGYAFLESPGNHSNGIDDDDDGIIDERRDSGAGTLIVGQEAIRAHVASSSRYDLTKFESKYGPLEQRPAFLAGRWWTGDEDMDWISFSDLNDSGVWEPGEPLNDDLGRDGLGPQHPNYPGPDEGEGDGKPTSGEQNFDELDKDESDQIGLTGFAVFDVHRYQLIDDAENFRVFSSALPPLADILLEGGRNLGMFFASGPFPLKAGQTERFSMALLFADKDFNDPRQMENSSLARKKEIVQQIYNADYQFSRPPDKSQLWGVAGDKMVTLYWDDKAEKSFDPFLGEYDFEGYMVYRSTEPNFEENLKITDAYGGVIYQKPIAQFDLINGIRGLHPVAVNGVQFNLGQDTGIRRSYVDTDVINGQTYYYSIVPYDRGFVQKDSDGVITTDQNGQVRGISPSVATANIKTDVSGTQTFDVNTVKLIPRAPAAGFVAPELDVVQQTRLPESGSVELKVLSAGVLREDETYTIRFENESIWQNSLHPTLTVERQSDGEMVLEQAAGIDFEESVMIDGWTLSTNGVDTVRVVPNSITSESTTNTYTVQVLPAFDSGLLRTRFIPLPNDFKMEFFPANVDTSVRVAFGMNQIPVPFTITNTTTGRRHKFAIIEDNPDLRNGQYDHGELIAILSGVTPDTQPIFAGGAWRASWTIRFIPPDPILQPNVNAIPPGSGSVFRFRTSKPFADSETITFTVRGGGIDTDLARVELSDIHVVPNPYVASSIFEPANIYRSGRGDRRIYFVGLPQECTIRIYTVSGQLVQTMKHQGSNDNGQMAWDLVSRDGMNISFGMYIYHVDAGPIGSHVGRFAVIK